MGKHVDAKIKDHYIMKYFNGESPIKLGLEVIDKGLSNVSDLKDAKKIIFNWKYQYYGLSLDNESSLKSIGRPKKKK